jgi:hypothetical protein
VYGTWQAFEARGSIDAGAFFGVTLVEPTALAEDTGAGVGSGVGSGGGGTARLSTAAAEARGASAVGEPSARVRVAVKPARARNMTRPTAATRRKLRRGAVFAVGAAAWGAMVRGSMDL